MGSSSGAEIEHQEEHEHSFIPGSLNFDGAILTPNSDPSSHGLIQALSTALTRGFSTKAAELDLIFIHGWTEVADWQRLVADEGIVSVARVTGVLKA